MSVGGASLERNTLQALVEAFAECQWLRAARQRNTLQALVEAFAKGQWR